MNRAKDSAAQSASVTLAAGVSASLLLLLAGLWRARAAGVPLPVATLPPGQILAAAAGGDPAGLFSLGLALLLATPALRVSALAWQFARRREWIFAAISLVVLGILFGSVFLGRGESE